jgi:type IV conjugative transfer system coupling protein TraD
MSIFRNDTVGSWTRGGQAIVHNVRMSTQVFFQTVLAGLILWVLGAVWYAFEVSTAYERFVLVKLIEASFKVDAAGGTNDPVQFHTPAGKGYWTSADWLFASKLGHAMLHKVEIDLIHGAMISGAVAGLALACAWFTFTRTGKGLGSNQFIRGARFGTARQLRRLLWCRRKGSFAIGGVPVPRAFEPEHILICGAPGTGKTHLILQMLVGIRKEGQRAIIYDTAGTFVEKFYRPGHDILLNPLDARSDHWSPWVDVPRVYHYDQIAEATIPDTSGDPFWAKAPRGTLVAVMRKLARDNRMLMSVLLDTVMRSKLKDLATFATGTDAAAFISVEGERTSAGIQAELASVMRSFSYLDDTRDGFSIRDWVSNERDDSWLFITVQEDQLPSLRPLITVWLDIAISAILSIQPDHRRRLYCIIDELPSLQRLPSLSRFLARARKYGGCGILGFQSYPQLEATYGAKEAAAVTGYCSTWVALRANDTLTAKHVSENLGQVEQVEANEGMSYGVNDMRDGVNLSRTQVTRPLVMPTEVTNLPNMAGFLRFGRNLPVLRFQDRYEPLPTRFPAFVDRTEPVIRLTEEEQPVSPPAPEPARTVPSAAPARKRKRAADKEWERDDDASPTLPFEKLAEDEGGERASPKPPRITLMGRRSSALRQHDRAHGDSNPAKPA